MISSLHFPGCVVGSLANIELRIALLLPNLVQRQALLPRERSVFRIPSRGPITVQNPLI
jgi:hypothetical protein